MAAAALEACADMHVIRAGLAAREGDADAYAWPDRHAVYMRRGLASLVVVEATVPRARVMHGPSPGGVRHDCRVGVMRRCALRNELDDELAVRLRERGRAFACSARAACMWGGGPDRIIVRTSSRPSRSRIDVRLSPAPAAGVLRGCAPRQPGQERGRVVRPRDRPNGQGQTMRDDARS